MSCGRIETQRALRDSDFAAVLHGGRWAVATRLAPRSEIASIEFGR